MPDPVQTREDFERAYAERSGVTVEWLRQHDRHVVRCDCEEDGCEGWAMVSIECTNHRCIPGFDENWQRIDGVSIWMDERPSARTARSPARRR